ncbi:MAG: transporter substrate-binding domain-containing protein [Rhodocyclaceae bacterium]|nr:transporter substrate-binding domain-containing protein [Rhodocyclaceae bacterium]MDZ4214621.1 transporter substrate-binding domain-containing protein [Rhodocyclaceae bacterium]
MKLFRLIPLLAALISVHFSFVNAQERAISTTPAAMSVRVAVPGNIFSRLEGTAPTGIFIESVDAILRQLGMVPRYLAMPTGDALRELKEGDIDIATVVVPLDRLKQDMHLSAPVIIEYNAVLFLREHGFKANKLSDFHGKRIAGRQGYRYPLLDADPAIHLNRYRTDGEMIRGVLLGHEDIAIIAGISDLYTFRAEGIMAQMDISPNAVGSVPLVAGFSKKRFSAEQIAEFDRMMAEFKKSQEWQAILQRNGMADLVRDWSMIEH